MSEREHWSEHQDRDCERCLAGFREAVGDSETPQGEKVVVLIVKDDRAMVLRAAA